MRQTAVALAAGVKGAIPQLAPPEEVARLFRRCRLSRPTKLKPFTTLPCKVLSEIGMDFTLPEARDLLKTAGADISGERVRFDPAMIEELMKSAPSQFTFHARNPENTA